MADTVPMRKLDVYQTDDGRRVEVFSICGSVALDTANDDEDSGQNFSDKTIYVGVVHIPTPDGPQEIKFEIPDVEAIEEAFDKYYDVASVAVEEIKKRWKQRQEEMENQIVTATPDTVRAIEQGQGPGNIIL